MAKFYITDQLGGAFHRALLDAEPGDEIVYHVGDHAAGPHRRDAFNAAQEGLCMIYQRRSGGVFEYTARKKRR